jgi:hypothetical protein
MKRFDRGVKVLLLAAISAVLFTQCRKEEADTVDCAGSVPTYNADVKAILDTHCASSGCHSASSKKAGYDFSTYESAKSGAADVAFLGSVQHKSGYSRMPRGASKLSAENVKTLTCWVQSGMPN